MSEVEEIRQLRQIVARWQAANGDAELLRALLKKAGWSKTQQGASE